MKKIIIKYIAFILLISIGLVACEKDSNIEVPNENPKLVTACFLSPSADGTDLHLTWSAPIFKTTIHQMPTEKNAKVYIIDGTNKYPLTYFASSELYHISKSQLQIVEGKKYKLQVESSKSETLTAETIIPATPKYSIAFQSYDSTRNQYDSQYYTYRYFIKLNITNPENKAYYRISAWYEDISYGGKTMQRIVPLNGENRIVYGDYSGNLVFVISKQDNSQIKKIYVSVHKVDETYYKYHHALENYQGTDFFSEPTLVYSNVVNGLGVFCSYNVVMDSVEVK